MNTYSVNVFHWKRSKNILRYFEVIRYLKHLIIFKDRSVVQRAQRIFNFNDQYILWIVIIVHLCHLSPFSVWTWKFLTWHELFDRQKYMHSYMWRETKILGIRFRTIDDHGMFESNKRLGFYFKKVFILQPEKIFHIFPFSRPQFDYRWDANDLNLV